jgi:peptide/nickel transport system ATP-binding protein
VALLEVRDLYIGYRTFKGVLSVVDGVSFSLERGESLALVGESGSGKTSIVKAILRSLPGNAIVRGEILFEGRNLLEADRDYMDRIKGTKIAYIPQEPLSALNQLFTIEEHFADRLILSDKGGLGILAYLRERRAARELRRAMAKALEEARIGEPERVLSSYPFQLSGGMLQRVLIAMAIATRPLLLLADEPTTALDVITQREILALLRDLQREIGMSILYVTHDLGVARMIADKILVLYAGQPAEVGPSGRVLGDPLHPYTSGLLGAIPRLSGGAMRPIEGSLPDYTSPPRGCRFHPRCPHSMERCRGEKPPGISMGDGRTVYCWLYEG